MRSDLSFNDEFNCFCRKVNHVFEVNKPNYSRQNMTKIAWIIQSFEGILKRKCVSIQTPLRLK